MHGKNPKRLLIISIVITLILGAGMSLIQIKQDEDSDQLPKNLEEIKVFMKMEDKFDRYNSIIKRFQE